MSSSENRWEEALLGISKVTEEVESGLASMEKFKKSSTVLESAAKQVEEALRALKDAAILLKGVGELLGKEGVVKFEGVLKKNLEEIQDLMKAVSNTSKDQAQELRKAAEANEDVEKQVSGLAREIEKAGHEIGDMGKRMNEIRELTAGIKKAQSDVSAELGAAKDSISSKVEAESKNLVTSKDATKRFDGLSDALQAIHNRLAGQEGRLAQLQEEGKKMMWIVWGLQALLMALMGLKLFLRS